jgi:ABC-2 type transport system ATP-binding protein
LAGEKMPSLQAVNLSKHYGSFQALSDLNLNIEGTKCVGFLGPNGAGKTTTLKIFCGMMNASKGTAKINDTSVKADKKRALASCGVLVETPEIYPVLTSREALSMFAELKGVPQNERKRMVEDVIYAVKMDAWIDKKVGTFSKGMKQRVNLAAAMLNDPEVLLLDEPTTGLDPRGMSEIREILRELKKDRLVFMSSHLLSEVSSVCDEIAIVNKGKLLVHDTIENVKSRLTGTRVFELKFCRPVSDDVFSKLDSLVSVTEVAKIDSKNVRLSISGDVEVQEKVVTELVLMKTGLVSFAEPQAALEESYLSLVKGD